MVNKDTDVASLQRGTALGTPACLFCDDVDHVSMFSRKLPSSSSDSRLRVGSWLANCAKSIVTRRAG